MFNFFFLSQFNLVNRGTPDHTVIEEVWVLSSRAFTLFQSLGFLYLIFCTQLAGDERENHGWCLECETSTYFNIHSISQNSIIWTHLISSGPRIGSDDMLRKRERKQIPISTKILYYGPVFWLPKFFSIFFPHILVQHITIYSFHMQIIANPPPSYCIPLRWGEIVLSSRHGSTWLCALWSKKTNHPLPILIPLQIKWHHLAVQSIFFIYKQVNRYLEKAHGFLRGRIGSRTQVCWLSYNVKGYITSFCIWSQ